MPDTDTDALDNVRFLARADSRVRVLEHLRDAGPADPATLRDAVDASRTTISRAVNALADEGWVERVDGAYRLTAVGSVVADEFSALLSTMRTVDELAGFLRWFPSDVDAPDFRYATDVSVTTTTDADPYAPARTQTEILHSADRLRVLLPATDHDSTETLRDQVVDHGLEIESVVSPAVESTLTADPFADLIADTLRTGRSTLYVASDPIPFYLGLADDGRTQVGVADDEGLPRALLETTDEDVRDWADGVYERYRESASHKSLDDF